MNEEVFIHMDNMTLFVIAFLVVLAACLAVMFRQCYTIKRKVEHIEDVSANMFDKNNEIVSLINDSLKEMSEVFGGEYKPIQKKLIGMDMYSFYQKELTETAGFLPDETRDNILESVSAIELAGNSYSKLKEDYVELVENMLSDKGVITRMAVSFFKKDIAKIYRTYNKIKSTEGETEYHEDYQA